MSKYRHWKDTVCLLDPGMMIRARTQLTQIGGGLAAKYGLFKTVDHRQKERHSPVQG